MRVSSVVCQPPTANEVSHLQGRYYRNHWWRWRPYGKAYTASRITFEAGRPSVAYNAFCHITVYLNGNTVKIKNEFNNERLE